MRLRWLWLSAGLVGWAGVIGSVAALPVDRSVQIARPIFRAVSRLFKPYGQSIEDHFAPFGLGQVLGRNPRRNRAGRRAFAEAAFEIGSARWFFEAPLAQQVRDHAFDRARQGRICVCFMFEDFAGAFASEFSPAAMYGQDTIYVDLPGLEDIGNHSGIDSLKEELGYVLYHEIAHQLVKEVAVKIATREFKIPKRHVLYRELMRRVVERPFFQDELFGQWVGDVVTGIPQTPKNAANAFDRVLEEYGRLPYSPHWNGTGRDRDIEDALRMRIGRVWGRLNRPTR